MSGVIKVTRMMLHEKMLEYREEPVEKRKNRVVEFLKESFRTNGNPMATKDLTQFMSQQFFAPYLKRWQDCSRTNSRFYVTPHLHMQCYNITNERYKISKTTSRTARNVSIWIVCVARIYTVF